MYTIGEFYTISTVKAWFHDRLDVWPVLGPKHEDIEHIGFAPQHYHLDYRFFNDRQYKFILRRTVRLRGYDIPLEAAVLFAELIVEIYRNDPLPKPVLRRRKCRRAMPSSEGAFALHRIGWLSKLYDAYADKILLPGRICPHRGAPLTGLDIDVEGCVTCPLHLLRWNIKTGKLQKPNSIKKRWLE